MNNLPTSDLAYRFEYADKSAFEVYVDGRAFIAFKDGRREEKHGAVTNNIPLLLGQIAKPRQDEIDRLRAAINRIDAINDNPADFNSEINAVCDSILRPHLTQQERKADG